MAEIKSVHSLMEDYQRHVTRLEELRLLLEERLVVARAELRRLVEQEAGHSGAVAWRSESSGNPLSGSGNAVGASLRQVRLHVIEIESAIERMDRGLYGTCKQCGAFIPLKELLRAPHEQKCAACGDAGHARSTA
ncbi:hypothetical protein AB0O34_30495 [Sphaerisporangium sp. NPDC088356]|uniref:TraR/DksA family transcriptional regulator n=1 Tax=Sphaerisporangium sp. NPDC088356 TaxID=3154871 RepID=UPI0034436D3B